jgi:hypothetical protein
VHILSAAFRPAVVILLLKYRVPDAHSFQSLITVTAAKSRTSTPTPAAI